MSSVGPQLPPHLSKRKRSPSDPDPPSSPPHKVVARTLGPTLPPSQNPDEVNLEESSEDEYGPSIPSTKASVPVGPSLPTKNPDEVNLEESSEDDDYGPSIPPTKAQPSSPPPAKRRVLGPAPPPASMAEMPSHPANPADDASPPSSDDDDDYGPSLPPAAGSHAETQYLQAARSRDEAQRSISKEEKKPQRAEWMIVPPTSDDWSARVDPTKLKNRKFASGKGAKGSGEKGGISAIWTETPEEKRRRLEDEVLGRKEKGVDERKGGRRGEEGVGERGEDGEISRRIREMRGRSLLEINEGGGGVGKEREKEKEDDPSQRGFDREKDMALGGRLGHGEKKEMLAKAKDFGSRFQRGRFL